MQLSQHTKPGTILRWSDLSASDGFDNYQVFGSLVTPPSPDNPCECTVRFSNGMATMSLHHLSIADQENQNAKTVTDGPVPVPAQQVATLNLAGVAGPPEPIITLATEYRSDSLS